MPAWPVNYREMCVWYYFRAFFSCSVHSLLAVLRTGQELCLFWASILVDSTTWNAFIHFMYLCFSLPSFRSLMKESYLRHNINNHPLAPSLSVLLPSSIFSFLHLSTADTLNILVFIIYSSWRAEILMYLLPPHHLEESLK